jgi:transposase
MRAPSKEISGADVSSVDSIGRQHRSNEFRRRIVAQALAPGASVAEVARRNGLNANLVFKWIQRARDGWVDGRRTRSARRAPKNLEPMAFVPVTMVESAALQLPGPSARISEAVAPPVPGANKRKPAKRRGVIEIALPDGARISVDAEVDETALRAVLSAMRDGR